MALLQLGKQSMIDNARRFAEKTDDPEQHQAPNIRIIELHVDCGEEASLIQIYDVALDIRGGENVRGTTGNLRASGPRRGSFSIVTEDRTSPVGSAAGQVWSATPKNGECRNGLGGIALPTGDTCAIDGVRGARPMESTRSAHRRRAKRYPLRPTQIRRRLFSLHCERSR